MKKVIVLMAFFVSLHSFSSENKIYYPNRAESLRISGSVDLLYDVNSHGRVENIRVLSSEPKYYFEKMVAQQMKLWRFKEASPKKDVPLHIEFRQDKPSN